MKILFTLESFFPSHRAGTEVYVLNLCHYFRSQGWQVAVLIATSNYQEDYTFEGVPVHTFDIPENANVEELNGIIPPRGIDYFLERVKDINPQVVHFHSFGRTINGYHLEAVKKMGINTVFTPHLGNIFCVKSNVLLYNKTNCDGQVIASRCLACVLHDKGINKQISKFLGVGLNQAINHKTISRKLPASFQQAHHRKAELERINCYADIVFSIAPWIQKAFELNGITKAKLIPQGISPLFFEEQLKSKKEAKSTLNFAFIGRMHPSKGFHLLKAAWEQLGDVSANLHIITNPSGGEQEYFNSHKSWANSKEEVIWNEALTQYDVAAYLNEIDVLILPSTSNEVAPLVILEAATRGIPVIGSDYIAIESMIKHKHNGLLFKNGSVEDLKTQMQTVLNSSDLLEYLIKNIEKPNSMIEVGLIVEGEIKHLMKTTNN